MTNSSTLSGNPKMAFNTTIHDPQVPSERKRGSEPNTRLFSIASMMLGRRFIEFRRKLSLSKKKPREKTLWSIPHGSCQQLFAADLDFFAPQPCGYTQGVIGVLWYSSESNQY